MMEPVSDQQEQPPADEEIKLPEAPDDRQAVGSEVIRATTRQLLIAGDQDYWTEAQRRALLSLANLPADTPNEVLATFFHNCQATGLDPFRREIYLIGRGKKEKKYTIQTGIDGFLHIAEDTGEYDGIEGPQWCGDDGVWVDVWVSKTPPTAARAGVRRKGHSAVSWGIAVYDEFVPMEEVWEGPYGARKATGRYEPAAMWQKMPSNQLAKCAIAQAVRKAFPRNTAGLYVNEEMQVADATERNEARREEEATAGRKTAAEQWRAADPRKEDIVDAEVLDDDIDTLRAEVARIAVVLDTSVSKLAVRMIRTLKKSYDEFTAAELMALIQSYRAQVPAEAPKPAEEKAPETAETSTEEAEAESTEPTEEELAAAFEAEQAAKDAR